MQTRMKGLLLVLTVMLVSACVPVRPVKIQPFADKTALLHQRTMQAMDRLISYYASLTTTTSRLGRTRKTRGQLQKLRSELKAYVDALQAYADSLAELDRAGRSGPAAARKLAGNISLMAAPFGVTIPLTATAAKLIDAVAATVTRVQAQRSLAAAVLRAQPAIKNIALLGKRLFNPCYGMKQTCRLKGMQGLTRILAGKARTQALRRAGATVIGFYRNARITRDKLYLQLNRDTRLPVDRTSGYCVRQDGRLDRQCLRHFRQLTLLELLERRIRAVEGTWLRYQQELAAINQWEQQQLNAQRGIMRALSAWSKSHASIHRTLSQGGRLKLRDLSQALREIRRDLKGE